MAHQIQFITHSTCCLAEMLRRLCFCFLDWAECFSKRARACVCVCVSEWASECDTLRWVFLSMGHPLMCVCAIGGWKVIWCWCNVFSYLLFFYSFFLLSGIMNGWAKNLEYYDVVRRKIFVVCFEHMTPILDLVGIKGLYRYSPIYAIIAYRRH